MDKWNCDESCQFTTECTKEHLLHHIRKGIKTKITNRQLDILPSRKDFLSPTLKAAFASQISTRKPVLFLPNSVVEKNDYLDGVLKLRIYLFGILPCGSKACVVLDNIDVHVDIMVPDGMTSREYDNVLRGLLLNKNLTFNSISDVMMYRPRGFQRAKRVYKRIMFSNLQDRKKVIEFIAELNRDLKNNGKPQIETAADDQSKNNFYFPKIAREFRFATADWNRFEKYEVMTNTSPNCDYMLRVDVRDFVKLSKTKRAELLKNPLIGPMIDRDPLLVMMWDIETHRTIQNGMVPTVKDTDFTIFMICGSYFHQHTDESLFNVCVVDQATNAREGIKLVIECGDELGVLRTHMEVVARMAPDLTGAFNGGNFDWPLYREKLKRNGLLTALKSKWSSLPMITKGKYADTEDSVLRWNFRSESIKIDAETKHNLDCVADFPGMLDTDVLPVFLKMYPKAEVRKSFSLNFFLAKNGLESKEDMPYKKMFKIYERAVKLAGIKSCHCGEAQAHCGSCRECVKDIDCIPLPDDMFGDKHRDLFDDDGRELCCYCGKKQRNMRDMADVGYYCNIDCLRPQQLYVKRTVIADKRELSNMSYVSLYDSFYRADGMKVRNVIGSYCHKYEMAFSNVKTNKSKSEKDHYPGAWVFPPVRGLNNKRPVTGLDFASLYPSLMMTYNLSPDMVVYTQEEADMLTALGYKLRKIEPFEYERGEKKGDIANVKHMKSGWTVRHNGVFGRKDTKTVSEYVKTITLTEGKTTVKYAEKDGPTDSDKILISEMKKPARRVTYVPVYGRDKLPGERMGIFSFIVKKLFDKRVPVKGEFVRLSKLKEQMELEKSDVYTVKVDGVETTYKKADVLFGISKVDSKQKALKVLSNTFYGESGNYMSAIYELLVAAGITTAGQENIKKVAGFVISKGFNVQYGDTDSLYLTCPDGVYEVPDRKYKAAMDALAVEFEGVPIEHEPTSERSTEYKNRRTQARVIYWTEMTDITMRVMSALKEEVSDFLLGDNGTIFLNMAYEEVGMPTVLTGKKKYFMTPHIAKINFYPEEYFIKGIDIVKQGQSKIAKMLGEEFIHDSLAPENERELIDIAEDKIRKFYKTKLDPSLFTLSAKYKPNKKNIPVLAFVARMREMQKKYANDPAMMALYEPPEAGDKFEYVIVKKDQRYTLQGCKIDTKKGDQMEFVRVYKASQNTPNPMELDINYYMEGAVNGLFARFIAYHPKFQPPQDMFDITDKEQYHKMDEFCVNAAAKYITELCQTITGIDKKVTAQVGRDYRKIYKSADKIIRADVVSRYGSAGYILHDLNIRADDDDTRAQSTRIIDQMKETAKDFQPGNETDYLALNEIRGGPSVFRLNQIYNGERDVNISRLRVEMCNRREAMIVEKLYAAVPKISRIIYKHERGIITLIDDMRKDKTSDEIEINNHDLEYLNALADEDRDTLTTVSTLMFDLIAVYRVRASVLAIVSAIKMAKAKMINEPIAPVLNVREISRAEAKAAPVLPDYEWV